MRMILLLALSSLAAPTVAVAQSLPSQSALRHQLRIDPDNPVVMINLARVYAKSGRTAEANRLLRGLLRMENVELDGASGTPVWSHALAIEALKGRAVARPVQISSRTP